MISNSLNSIAASLYSKTAGNTGKTSKSSEYGKTVGNPSLSDTAKDYYEELKSKYSDFEFVLVSEDEEANAKENAASYATSDKTIVLISEDEVEAMATDETTRNKYEGILDNAKTQLADLQSQLNSTGANVAGYGIQINDDGTTSFFAVLRESSAKQKERIEEAREEKAQEKKEESKTREKKLQEKSEESTEKTEKTEKKGKLTVISANSMEELVTRVGDYALAKMSDNVQTEEELAVGQNINFEA